MESELARLFGATEGFVFVAMGVFARVGAALFLVPGFGERSIPMRVKLGGALAMVATRYLRSDGLGATRWQTVSRTVLPNAVAGIMTGIILAVARAIGETAPLILVGALTFIPFLPQGALDQFTALPIQIFNWTARPQDEFQDLAAAAIVVLMVLLLSMNLTAILLRNHFEAKRAGG